MMKDIRLLVLDVDGTLSDGTVYMGSEGEVCKAFSIKDGLGLKLMGDAGIQLAIITGRCSRMVELRAKELGIQHIVQGAQIKTDALLDLCKKLDIPPEETAYMGDDLNDLAVMDLCGLTACPADAAEDILARADYVARQPGGRGAVRDFVETYLKEKGLWAPLAAARYQARLG